MPFDRGSRHAAEDMREQRSPRIGRRVPVHSMREFRRNGNARVGGATTMTSRARAKLSCLGAAVVYPCESLRLSAAGGCTINPWRGRVCLEPVVFPA